MGPPIEQLIRDYLNRLSVAARDRLGPEDRRALVDRTRKLIERKADFAGRPTTLEVGRVLARLGDPAVLVEQELRRLAAVRGEQPGGPPQLAVTPGPVEPPVSSELAEPAEAGSSRGFFARVLRRESGRAWRSSSGWPAAVAIENGAVESSTAPASAPLKPQWPSVVARDGGAAYPQSDLPVRNGTTVGAAITTADANGVNGTGSRGDTATPDSTGTPNGTGAFETETGDDFEPARSAAVGGAVTLLTRIASWVWQQPLEATAIILLGLGGVIFPPVFVLGALVALGSRLWHYRDKWVGLVLPLVLTIIGIAAGVAVGGRSHGLHYGWVTLNIVSRVAALLGAGYLAWRTGPGRRPPPAPPWHKPRRAA
jgi:hypothetical protein